MNVLVTGGAGYIGAHAVKALIEEGYDVSIVDNLSTSDLRNVHSKAHFFPISIHDQDAVESILIQQKIDSIMHFAAFSLVQESVENPLKYYHNNVEGTRALLQAMQNAGVNDIIFSSTAAVYGEPTTQPIKETTPCNPKNPYGASKKAIEDMLYWTSQTSSLNYIALRYFNVAGASADASIGENHDPETHLIPNILKSLKHQSQAFQLFGTDFDTKDGTAIRDYIHVEDLIDAHILALKHLKNTKKSDIFNLGSQQGYSVKDILNVTEKVLNVSLNIVKKERRSGDPAVLIADAHKAETILNFTCQRDLASMIESANNYFVKQGGKSC